VSEAAVLVPGGSVQDERSAPTALRQPHAWASPCGEHDGTAVHVNLP